MKIENTVNTAASSHPGGMPATRGVQKSSETAPRDGVHLSTQLQNINKNLATTEAFDAERVEKIKQAISEGRFTINPEKVADRLLESVQELRQTRRG